MEGGGGLQNPELGRTPERSCCLRLFLRGALLLAASAEPTAPTSLGGAATRSAAKCSDLTQTGTSLITPTYEWHCPWNAP